jgi:hypothetical protein
MVENWKRMVKPKPTDWDFEAAVLEVFRENSDKDFVDGWFLGMAVYQKILGRFSRRAIHKTDIWPQVYLAIQRLVTAGRIRHFSVANGGMVQVSRSVLFLVIDRETLLDTPNIDE